MGVAVTAAAGDLNSRGRAVGDVAVDDAVAVVHGTDKLSRAALLALALALRAALCVARLVRGVVAGLRGRGALLEELLLLPTLALTLPTILIGMARVLRRRSGLKCGLGLRRLGLGWH